MTTLSKEKELINNYTLLITEIKSALNKAGHLVELDRTTRIPNLKVSNITILADLYSPYILFDNSSSTNEHTEHRVIRVVQRIMHKLRTNLFLYHTRKIKGYTVVQPPTHNSKVRKAHESILKNPIDSKKRYYTDIREEFNFRTKCYEMYINNALFSKFETGTERDSSMGKLSRAEKAFNKTLKSLESLGLTKKETISQILMESEDLEVTFSFAIILEDKTFKMKIENNISGTSLTVSPQNMEIIKSFMTGGLHEATRREVKWI